MSSHIATLTVVGIVCAPLYATLGGLLWKLGLFRGVPGDVDSNEDEIRSIQRDLAEVRRDVALLKQDMHMIHDLIAEENHCGSPNCRFCEYDREEEIGDGVDY